MSDQTMGAGAPNHRAHKPPASGLDALHRLRRHCTCLLPLAGWLAACGVHAQSAPTQSDFGGAGLWQTPTARMATEGEIAFTASHTSPYARYNFTLQPLPWLEGSFRYVSVSNRRYGSYALSGNQHYKDKSIDLKLRLWQESRYLPELSVGGRDIGGTGLFSSEYAVANKRLGPFDASLGIAWGYLGNRGDITNPLAVFGDQFNTRPGRARGSSVGNFNGRSYLHGHPAFFGGLSYQTQWQPLLLKLEYDGNDYRHEPQKNNQRQDSPFNVGAVYRLNRHIDLSAALERGNTATFGLTLHTNLAAGSGPVKVLDPAPPVRAAAAPMLTPEQVDWAKVSRELEENAGIRVSRISRQGSELIVAGEQTRYFYKAKGIGRTARVLDNQLGPQIDWYTLTATREGMATAEISVHRPRFDALLDHEIDLADFRRSIEHGAPVARRDELLYQPAAKKLDTNMALGYAQSLGGPDAFLLYQVAATFDAEYHFTPNLWWSGSINANLINNYDLFKYTAPSKLPRVRTYIRQYLTSSRITMPLFQLTASRQLGPDLYGLAYAGMLESMFGGAGGEVLYRPFGERWALGANINWVRQRSFDQDFSFLDRHGYSVVTGHASAYVDTGYRGVLVTLSAGRYLAGDWGGTIDVSREFRNGVRMGAYATLTNVSAKQFGEGSFDKGIYVSIPFDLMLPRSTTGRANFLWAPLIRDGGAILGRSYTLYSLTNDRDGNNLGNNLQQITE